MKRTVLLIIFLFTTGIATANAEGSNQYYLIKAGLMMKDDSPTPDNLTALGLTWGYGLSNQLALELGYNQSISGGGFSDSATSTEGDYSLWFINADIAYRKLIMERAYFKGKFGFTYGEEKVKISGFGSDSDDLITPVIGLGAGYAAGAIVGSSTTFELEYNYYFEDLMALTVGANITF